MCKIPKLELEFEIATLSHNIENYEKLRLDTADMHSRLEYCQAKLYALNMATADKNSRDLSQ